MQSCILCFSDTVLRWQCLACQCAGLIAGDSGLASPKA